MISTARHFEVKRLIDTINGQSCEICAISHHNRIKVGNAAPEIEIYENAVEVPTIGTSSIRYKRTYFTIVICPDPEMTEDILKGLTAFNLSILLPRKADEVFVSLKVYGAPMPLTSPRTAGYLKSRTRKWCESCSRFNNRASC